MRICAMRGSSGRTWRAEGATLLAPRIGAVTAESARFADAAGPVAAPGVARRGAATMHTCMRPHHLLTLTSLALALAGCGGSSGYSSVVTPPPPGGGTCTPGTGTVCLEASNSFNPASITVARGSAVTWVNKTGVTHNVTFDPMAGAPSSSGNFASGQFQATFPTAGTYPYHCTIHGLSMSGKVIVQ